MSPTCSWMEERRRKRQRGLTLTELIITLVMVSVLVGAVWLVYGVGFEIFHTQGTRTVVKGEAGRGFIRITEELRQATSLTAAEPTNFTLTRDTDDNGVDETIQYTWSGTAGTPLNRVSDATTPLVNSVNSLVFSYYDAGANLLSFPVTASAVRRVAIDLTVTQQDETFELRSQARLRNL